MAGLALYRITAAGSQLANRGAIARRVSARARGVEILKSSLVKSIIK